MYVRYVSLKNTVPWEQIWFSSTACFNESFFYSYRRCD